MYAGRPTTKTGYSVPARPANKAMVATTQFALAKLALVVDLLLLFHYCRAQQGVCYSSLSQQQSYSGYVRQYYFYYVGCGYSSICPRYAYRQQLRTLYRTTYYSQRHCCTGYRSCDCQSCGSECISCSSGCCPICDDCDTNHTCIAPDTCVCPTGWTGPDCDIDIDECIDTQLDYTQLNYTLLNNTQLNDTQFNDTQRNDTQNSDARHNNTQLCEQICTNTVGSYNCSCSSDYNLADDLHSCLGMPENITFNATSSRSMILSWDPPGEDLRNGTIQRYSIICSSDDHVGFYLQQTILASYQSILMTGLNPFISYNCCIATITTNGNGPYRCDSGITLEDVPGDPPTSIVVTNTSAYSLFIEWEPPYTPNGIIVNYTIYLDYNNGTTDIRITDSNTTEYLLEGLSPHQLVGVEMTANTSIGEGPTSAIQEIRTHQAVPTAVTALDTERTSNISLRVTWGLPEVLNGILVYYAVNVSSTSIGYFETWRIQADDPLQLNISNLEPYVPYTIEVSAATHAGEGDVNTIIDFTEDGIPDVPAITSTNRISATDIQVTWTQLTLEESRGFPTLYSVAYSPCESTTCPEVDPEIYTILTTSSENSQLVISNLDPRLKYCVGIAASTMAGTGNYSATVKVQLYINSLFQLRFSGIDNCVDWVHDKSQEKVMEIVNLLVEQITNTCACGISNQYVTDLSLTCEMRDDETAIFQARIISTVETRSTELLRILQDWARDEPIVIINYVQLRLVMECSVQLNEIGETECIPIDSTTTPPPTTSETDTITASTPQPTVIDTVAPATTTPQPTVIDTMAPATTTPQPPVIVIITVIIVCGAALIIIIIIVIICCCYLKRKKKKQENITRDNPIYRFQNATLKGISNPIAGDNIHDVVEENLYENTKFQETTSTTYENTNFDETD